MGKLNQVIAVVAGRKPQAQKAITEVYHKLQKEALLKGIARTYKPKDEDGEKLPPESKMVQFRVGDALKAVAGALADLFDVIATQEYANTTAKADVKVDGTVVLPAVPVTYLMFLEKQLVDLHTLVSKLPTLDPGEEWSFNEATNSWATKAAETGKTKKVFRNHELTPATDKHPAQVQVYTEDITIGYWSTINYSGAIPETKKTELVGRVEKLQEAVKIAREEANSIEVTEQHTGNPVFEYLFGD